MNFDRCSARRCAVLLVGLILTAPSPAQYILFDQPTDTISVPGGNTTIGTALTIEARVMFCPGLVQTNGVIFQEQYNQFEDKALYAFSNLIGGTAQTPIVPSTFSTPIPSMLACWHHVAFVYDGTYQRLYFDGLLYNARPVTGDVDDFSSSLMTIGAFVEPAGAGAFRGAFAGILDYVRVSNVVRYTGPVYTVPPSVLTTDGATLLIYNFSEPPLSPVVMDSSGNGLVGTLGVGIPGATFPTFGAVPCGLGLPEYQVNQPGIVTGNINGVIGTPWCPAVTTVIPPGTIVPMTTAAAFYDIAIDFGPALPASGGTAITLPDGQIFNLNLATVSWFCTFGPFPFPCLSGTMSFSLYAFLPGFTFTFQVVGFGVGPLGVALSQPFTLVML